MANRQRPTEAWLKNTTFNENKLWNERNNLQWKYCFDNSFQVRIEKWNGVTKIYHATIYNNQSMNNKKEGNYSMEKNFYERNSMAFILVFCFVCIILRLALCFHFSLLLLSGDNVVCFYSLSIILKLCKNPGWQFKNPEKISSRMKMKKNKNLDVCSYFPFILFSYVFQLMCYSLFVCVRTFHFIDNT